MSIISTNVSSINNAGYLSRSVTTSQGRVYEGGLVKFEPREMERLLVPAPELLAAEGQSRRVRSALRDSRCAPLGSRSCDYCR